MFYQKKMFFYSHQVLLQLRLKYIGFFLNVKFYVSVLFIQLRKSLDFIIMSFAQRIVILALLFLAQNVLAQNPNLVSIQQTIVSSSSNPTTSNSNQPTTVSKTTSTTTTTTTIPQTTLTSVIDIVPSNQYTYSSSMNGINNPSPVFNSGYFNYQNANSLFQAFLALNQTCLGTAHHIQNVAFKIQNATTYLTFNQFYFTFNDSTNGPSNVQLFGISQNIDCTWSIKASDGRYVSLNTQSSYLMLSSTIGMYERFYLERKDGYMYIQSALFYRNFWTSINGIGMFGLNQASRFVMEIWPSLNVGWN